LISLTPYGRRELLLAGLLLGLPGAAAVWAGLTLGRWYFLAAGPMLTIGLWAVWFFRDPERTVPDGAGLFVAPADGRVADVTPLGADCPLGCDGVRIGIFMSVFDVHVNRMPCDGEVRRIEHRSGTFLDARSDGAVERNESATITLDCDTPVGRCTVVIRQVAGLVARRIVTDLSAGREVRRGERFGMIKFGSRLELLLPTSLGCEVRVRPGQRVRAGETVLAALPGRKDSHA
jgi:phosphatidylserine decarboxylase